MKKIASIFLIYFGLISTAFADIIDVPPFNPPAPIPAPTPEDDSETSVIKTLVWVGLFASIMIIASVKHKKSKVKEY